MIYYIFVGLFSQPAITCSKSTRTPEQDVKYVKICLLLTLNIYF